MEGTGKGLGMELGYVLGQKSKKGKKSDSPPPLDRIFNSRKELMPPNAADAPPPRYNLPPLYPARICRFSSYKEGMDGH